MISSLFDISEAIVDARGKNSALPMGMVYKVVSESSAPLGLLNLQDESELLPSRNE